MSPVPSAEGDCERTVRLNEALVALAGNPALYRGDQQVAFRTITEAASAAMEVRRASIWFYTAGDRGIACADIFEAQDGSHTQGMVLDGEDFPCYFAALREEVTIAADDARQDPRTREFAEPYLVPFGITSMLDVPIRVRGLVRGVVCHEHVGPARAWSAEEQGFATAVSCFASMAIEIAERDRAQALLAERERELRVILDNLPRTSFLYTHDTQGVFTFVSPSVSDVLGHSVEEFCRHYTGFLTDDPVNRDVVSHTEASLRGERQPPYEVAIRHRDGTERRLEVSESPLQDERGAITGVTGIAIDVTERRRAEQERLELERRLLHAQKLESLGILAGGIAHDFNNLLLAILGNLDVARDQLPRGAAAREGIERALSAAHRSADLTGQMLAYSGRGTFLVRPLDLHRLVEENAHLLRAAVPKNVTFAINAAGGLPVVAADPAQLQQVVMNLLINAAEAIGAAPGVITLTTGVDDFDDAYLSGCQADVPPPAGRYVFLEVADTGAGMDRATMQRIFDPFFTTKALGRGLGMSAILGIARGHRGAVLVRTEEGRGTAIRVLFPEAVPDARRPGVAGADPASTEGGGKPPLRGLVLIVDDEEMIRTVCASMVKALGMEAITAAGGEAALEIACARAGEIRCALVDLSMPGRDGLATCAALRGVAPGLPVILSSGFHESEVAGKCPGERPAGFLQKPYTLEKLRRALERVIGVPPG